MKRYNKHRIFAKIFLTLLAISLIIAAAFLNMNEIESVKSIINGIYTSITSIEEIPKDIIDKVSILSLNASVLFLILALIAINKSYRAATRVINRGVHAQVSTTSVYTSSKKDSKKIRKQKVEEQKMKSREERLAAKELAKKLKEEKKAAKLAKKAVKKVEAVAEKSIEKAAEPINDEIKNVKEKKIEDILDSLK